MKKRIIALVLVLAMSVLALVGCGEYDYSDVDLEDCTSVNLTELQKALLNVIIEDGEFTTDKTEREKQTWDLIWRSLANADNSDPEEYKTGAPDMLDLVYYCYYASAVVDGKTHIFTFQNSKGNSYMLDDYATYLQLGLYDNEDNDLVSAIIEALEGKKFEDYAYEINTDKTAKVEAGDYILVSFTYTCKTTDEEGKVDTVKKTVSNLPIYVPQAEGEYTVDAALSELVELEEFLNSLVGKTVAKKYADAYKTPVDQTEEGDSSDESAPQTEENTETVEPSVTVTYTDVTVSGIIEGGKALEDIEVVTYPSEAEDDSEGEAEEDTEEDTDQEQTTNSKNKLKDIFGDQVDLTDVQINYYVYPVYYKSVSFGAKEILTVFYGSEITVDALEIFSSEDYVYTYTEKDETTGEDKEVTKTLVELIKEFATLQKTYETEKAALDKAQDSYDDAKEDLDAAKKKLEELATTLNDAEAKLADATKAVADALAAKNTADAAYEALKNNSDATSEEIEAAKAEAEAAAKAYNTATTEENKAKDFVDQTKKNIKTAEEDLEEEQKAFDKADEALNGTKEDESDPEDGEPEASLTADETDQEDKKEPVVGAKQKFEQAETERNAVVEKILNAEKKPAEGEESEEDGEIRDLDIELDFAEAGKGQPSTDVEALILTDFKQSCYENLEDGYFEEINKNIMVVVYNAIKDFVIVNKEELPRGAVNEFYDKLYESHKYEFFTSANSTASTTLYETYNGDFELYLITETKTSSFSAAKDKLKSDARDYVAEIVRIYAAAKALGYVYSDDEFEADFEEEYNESLAEFYAYYGMEYMTEQSFRNAKQADKLFNGLLEVAKDSDGRVETNDDGLFDYKKIKYTFKTKA